MVSERDDAIRLMRAQHSRSSQFANGPVFHNAQLRESCEHHDFVKVDEHWMQCPRCFWCKPRLGRPPKLERLPAILKGRVLPPLFGKVDLHKVYCDGGFVIDDDRESVLSMVRVRVVQHTWVSHPGVRKCGVEVRFRELGWKEAAVFVETALHRLLSVLRDAEPRKPKALWLAVQRAYEINPNWPRPWLPRIF